MREPLLKLKETAAHLSLTPTSVYTQRIVEISSARSGSALAGKVSSGALMTKYLILSSSPMAR